MTSFEREAMHRKRVAKKHDEYELLKALHETWESRVEPDDPYLMHLRERIRRAENQLRNYGP